MNKFLEITKNVILNISDLVRDSFKLAWKGKEKRKNIYYWWGIAPYFVTYLVLEKLIQINTIAFIDYIIAVLIILYFLLHIILIYKNRKILTKKEKEALKKEKEKNKKGRVMRKIMLKEPFSETKPGLVYAAIDLFIITHYLEYIS